MIRSLLFTGQMYLAMGVIGLFGLPVVLASDRGAVRVCHAYAAWVRWTAAWMLGLRTDIRGTPPTGDVLVAAKHQSFLDVMLIFAALPRPRFVMKAELLRMPVFGWYVRRLGCIPVTRGQKGQMAAMIAASDGGGQLVIYPQGARVPVGQAAPYKYGAAALYEHLGLPCVPVATNAGRFWPLGLRRHAGLAVVEFLPPIPPGLPPEEFLTQLEAIIEPASDRL